MAARTAFRSASLYIYSLFLGLFFIGGAAPAVARSAKEFPTRDAILAEFPKSFPKTSQGQTVDKFFDKRDSLPALEACRGWLNKRVAEYEKAESEGDFAKMEWIMGGDREKAVFTRVAGAAANVSGVAFNKARDFVFGRVALRDGLTLAGDDGDEEAAVTAESSLMELLGACGRCKAVVRVVKGTVIESDGWCRAKESPEMVYEKGAPALKQWNSYPRHWDKDQKLKGFDYILAFGNEETMEPEGEIANGSRAVIAVRALDSDVVGNLGFGYYGDIYFDDQAKAPVKHLIQQFELPEAMQGEKIPGAYQKITDPVSEKVYKISTLSQEVFGRWFVDAQGNSNYKTLADFGAEPLEEMVYAARKVMMTAVFKMHRNCVTKK